MSGEGLCIFLKVYIIYIFIFFSKNISFLDLENIFIFNSLFITILVEAAEAIACAPGNPAHRPGENEGLPPHPPMRVRAPHPLVLSDGRNLLTVGPILYAFISTGYVAHPRVRAFPKIKGATRRGRGRL